MTRFCRWLTDARDIAIGVPIILFLATYATLVDWWAIARRWCGSSR